VGGLYLLGSTVPARALMPHDVPARVFEVGPGKTYTSTHEIALHALQPGDVIRIYAKPGREPYYEKLFIAGVGTAQAPIHIVGMPDAAGNKPIFDGYEATSDLDANYWNEDRQVILLGQYGNREADHVIVEGLEVRGAAYGDPFTDDAGSPGSYASNAAGIRASWAGTVTIRDCDVHGNENGIFSSHTDDLLIEHSHVHDNGLQPTSAWQHNLYLGGGAGSVVTVQYSHIGELLNDGQQAKFRTESVVFRYNWVEGGKNSVLDLVEDADNGVSDAYVYGNVLIKPAAANNSRMIHFGGDQAGIARSGTLHFFNNTCVVKTTNRDVRIFQVSEPGAHVVVDNNIFYKDQAILTDLYVYETSGQSNITGSDNWLAQGALAGDVLLNSLTGLEPGFVNGTSDDYHLAANAAVIDGVTGYTFPGGHTLDVQYVVHRDYEPRPQLGALDLGAFELRPTHRTYVPLVLREG
jgi:hypothetical protein